MTVAVAAATAAGAFALRDVEQDWARVVTDQGAHNLDLTPTPDPDPAGPTGPEVAPTVAEQVTAELAATVAADLTAWWPVTATAAATGQVACHPGTGAPGHVQVTGSGPDGAVSVDLEPAPAGTATATVTARAQSPCPGHRLARSSAHPTGAPAGFTATVTAPPTGPGKVTLTQVTWSRGDVLVTVTAATADGQHTPDRDLVAAAVAAVDGAVLAALAPVCPDLAPTAADATRNPAWPGYTGRRDPLAVTVPPVPPVPDPAAPDPARVVPQVPDPAPVPDLAPLLPRPQGDQPGPQGEDEAGDPWDGAARGPAPVLVDPAAFAPAPQVGDPGREPVRPTAPTTVTFHVPAPDPDGPGCGWAFTGQDAPGVDVDELAAAREHAARQAIADATGARARTWVATLDWARTWPRWAAAKDAADQVAAYEQARAEATARWEQATAAWQASVDAWLAGPTPTDPDPDPGDEPDPDPTPGGQP